jgi:3',5'-cyclic-AMP phosphodiesterase
MSTNPFRILQISDTHLFADANKELLGVKTSESFAAVLNVLREKNEKPQMIILSGDLSQDGSESSYRYLAEQLEDFKVPVYCIPGNHDDGKQMAHVYPYKNISGQRHVLLEHWQVILLDSQIPNAVEGCLDASQLAYLKHCLQAYPEHRAIIVFHHHPVPTGCGWLDPIGLTNADEFWETVSNYPQAHTVLFGHIHQLLEGKKNSLQYFSTPSTCIQFKPESKAFALDEIPPAYRWINLFAEGKMETDVVRAKEYVGKFEVSSKGY